MHIIIYICAHTQYRQLNIQTVNNRHSGLVPMQTPPKVKTEMNFTLDNETHRVRSFWDVTRALYCPHAHSYKLYIAMAVGTRCVMSESLPDLISLV